MRTAVALLALMCVSALLSGCSQGEEVSAYVPGPTVDGLVLLVHEGTPLGAEQSGAVCSGSLVGRSVVTAAHCVVENVEVAFPDSDCRVGPSGRVPLGVPQIAPGHDLAVLPLLGDPPKPLTTPEPETDETLSVHGWSSQNAGGVRVCGLQAVQVSLISARECDRGTSSGAILCARSTGRDVCSGDSGAPLIDSAARLIGVVSYGFGCRVEGVSAYEPVCPMNESLTLLRCSYPSSGRRG